MLIGGAGSGKTALTLEKLKAVDGDVLYVTHSAYLAQNARDLYYAQGFERDGCLLYTSAYCICRIPCAVSRRLQLSWGKFPFIEVRF